MRTFHLAERFAEQVTEHPKRDCLVLGNRRLTYAQVDGEAGALAAAFGELGIEPRDRVAVDLPNWPEWVFTILACARTGAVIVPLNSSLGFHELKYQLRHAEVNLAVAADALGGLESLDVFDDLIVHLPDLQYLVTVGRDDVWDDDRVFGFTGLLARGAGKSPLSAGLDPEAAPLAIIYTSGTMGKPKGVVLTHRNLVVSAAHAADALRLEGHDRVLGAVPLFSVFGVHVVITALVAS